MPKPEPPLPHRPLFGLPMVDLPRNEAAERIVSAVLERPQCVAVTPNVDHLVLRAQTPEFARAYNAAEIVLPDGMPLIWASRLLGRPLHAKLSGSDLMSEVCGEAAARGLSVYLLGAREGIAAKAAARLQTTYPALKVAGVHSPPFGFDDDEAATRQTIERVRTAAPDILFVAMGAPRSEIWVQHHRGELAARLIMSVGATFDFIAGETRRAPQWMQRVGLEWFYRFLIEPRRMFARYFVRDPYFLVLLWREWRARKEPVCRGEGVDHE